MKIRKTKEQKRTESEERAEKWQALTPKEQLASLDKRGMRALKQRARLQKLIAKEK